jgi:hypothetical protein
MYKPLGAGLLAAATVLFSPLVRAQTATATLVPGETPQSMQAAQIRMQDLTCDKPDIKRSRPDRAGWVLKCSITHRTKWASDHDHAGRSKC